MAEVGLLPFARKALEIARAVLPRYSCKKSKHVFTQPQLFAILCLMRYEDWTFREAPVRLCEHRELRKTLKLKRVPCHTTLYEFLKRLDETTLKKALSEVVRRMPDALTVDKPIVAVDGTGLEPGSVSTYFVHRIRGPDPATWRHWVKWLLVVDVPRRLLVAQAAKAGPTNDSATLRPLVREARSVTSIGAVVADAEFDSEKNHRFIRSELKARSAIPAKRGKATWVRHGTRAIMQRHFPRKLYGQRSLVESVISAVKRKLSVRAPGRTLGSQRKQALLLGVAYDIYRAIHVRIYCFRIMF